MTAKVCPRCGSQYENFKSTTCPQCFAILVAVDEATAEELSAARAEVERSPEFQETKLADDERFRQQSFGACLTIAALTLVTLVLVVVLLVSAVHRRTAHTVIASVPQAAVVKEEPLTTLPVAAAFLEDVLPPAIAPYQRQSADAKTVLTGTLTPLFHGVYVRRPLAPTAGGTLDVYALPAGRPTAEQNESGWVSLWQANWVGQVTQHSSSRLNTGTSRSWLRPVTRLLLQPSGMHWPRILGILAPIRRETNFHE